MPPSASPVKPYGCRKWRHRNSTDITWSQYTETVQTYHGHSNNASTNDDQQQLARRQRPNHLAVSTPPYYSIPAGGKCQSTRSSPASCPETKYSKPSDGEWGAGGAEEGGKEKQGQGQRVRREARGGGSEALVACRPHDETYTHIERAGMSSPAGAAKETSNPSQPAPTLSAPLRCAQPPPGR